MQRKIVILSTLTLVSITKKVRRSSLCDSVFKERQKFKSRKLRKGRRSAKTLTAISSYMCIIVCLNKKKKQDINFVLTIAKNKPHFLSYPKRLGCVLTFELTL